MFSSMKDSLRSGRPPAGASSCITVSRPHATLCLHGWRLHVSIHSGRPPAGDSCIRQHAGSQHHIIANTAAGSMLACFGWSSKCGCCNVNFRVCLMMFHSHGLYAHVTRYVMPDTKHEYGTSCQRKLRFIMLWSQIHDDVNMAEGSILTIHTRRSDHYMHMRTGTSKSNSADIMFKATLSSNLRAQA